MKILNIQPVAHPSGGAMRVIAYFDLQLSDDVRLYGLRLLQAPDGNRITYAPQSGSRRTATFAQSLAERITEAATNSLEAVTAHGTTTQN